MAKSGWPRERNTGRRVAIKFYAHRGGLDWSLLCPRGREARLSLRRPLRGAVGGRRLGRRPALLHHGVSRKGLAGRPHRPGARAGRRGGVAVPRRGHRAGPRPRQGRAALRPEAGQHPLGPGRQAAAGRFRSVAALDRAGAGVGDDVLHGARSRPTWTPCPTPAGTCTPWARCCTAC